MGIIIIYRRFYFWTYFYRGKQGMIIKVEQDIGEATLTQNNKYEDLNYKDW